MKKLYFQKQMLGILTVLALSLSGCHNENSNLFKIELQAEKCLNFDIYDSPAPVVVVLHQLKESLIFEKASYFDLYNKAPQILSPHLLKSDEVEIRPGETFVKNLEILPESKYLGIMAAFRDISHSHWKELINLQDFSSDGLKLYLQGFDIKVKINDAS